MSVLGAIVLVKNREIQRKSEAVEMQQMALAKKVEEERLRLQAEEKRKRKEAEQTKKLAAEKQEKQQEFDKRKRIEHEEEISKNRNAIRESMAEAKAAQSQGKLSVARSILERAAAEIPADLRVDLRDEVQILSDRLATVTQAIQQNEIQLKAKELAAQSRKQDLTNRLDQAEQDIESARYPEAIGICEGMLKATDLPDDLRSRAIRLRDQARESLKRIWGGSKMGPITQRKTD